MSRQDANAAFARTSFLYGGNADYIENLYARYEADPAALDGEWQAFFESLKDDRADVAASARGPSWQRPQWPQPARSELVSALDGDWQALERSLGDKVKARAQAASVEFSVAEVQQTTRDSIRATTRKISTRARMASPKRTTTARSFWTACSVSNSARCGKFSRSFAARTARRSASSSCTSPTPRRRVGYRHASRGRTKKSRSRRRAS